MRISLLLVVPALTLGLVPSSAVRGTVVTLNPTADAFVTTGPTNNLSGNNYGGAGALAVSAPGSPNGEFQSVLSFNTSSAKSAFDGLFGAGMWRVESVTLQLTATAANNAIFNANTGGSFALSWMQNDGWTEGTGNPNGPAATGINYTTLQNAFINAGTDETLGTFTYDGSSSTTSVYTLGKPAGFTADLLAGNSISLRALAASGAVSYVSNSRTASAPAGRPLLSINAVPEPGLLALLMLGGVMGAVRRRTRG